MTAGRSRGRRIAAAAGAMIVLAAVALGMGLREQSGSMPVRPSVERAELLLLTSLPIVFSERFTLDAPQSPVLGALESRYRVRPISTADLKSLGGGKLLLMAQPQAQPANVLVELDRWVRSGGRVLLLADPLLEWPSDRPLGDLLRPPPGFADTGLLGHWGLRLDSPDTLGPATALVEGRAVHTLSPGTLVATSPGCSVEAKGLVARCSVGKGRATVVADADFADAERRREPARSGNLDFLLAELDRLEQ